MAEILSFLSLVGWCIGLIVFVGVIWDRSRREARKREPEREADAKG